jgi:hypothetical protein
MKSLGAKVRSPIDVQKQWPLGALEGCQSQKSIDVGRLLNKSGALIG